MILDNLDDYVVECGFPWILKKIEDDKIHGVIIFTLPDGKPHMHPIVWKSDGWPVDVMNNICLRLKKRKR